jgi:multidrug efflux pump subunit AcrB
MFERFTGFFLKNEKMSVIFILMISIFWFLSYILLPKQYNPSIVAPAFLIEIPSSNYDAQEWYEYVIKSLENKLYELPGIDNVYGYATDGYISVMVAFKVGIKQEDAKTRLYDKMYSNMDLKPYGIENIQIRSIDPEDLPQVAYAITYSGSDIDERARGQYLRNIANTLREGIKKIPWTTTIEIIGGYSNDISIELIPEKIEAYGLDLLSMITKLQTNFWKNTIGSLSHNGNNYSVILDQNTDSIKKIRELILSDSNGKKIYLQDVANVRSGPIDIHQKYKSTNIYGSHDAVFVGIAKLQWTNAVHIVEEVHKTVEQLQKTLPKNISIVTIQDEGETASHATNELMLHLFVSIAIVLVILIVFLWVRDAINAAFCIPMVLGIVFIVALILGLDINRITLFALILSLGILVDDSIVMVENNARHLAMIPKTGKTKHEAILDSVREVGVSIVLSTITRVISFVAMFAVTGMMGDYMKPIPIFASIALTASLVIAFSINPFLASLLYNPKKETHHASDWGKFLNWYGKKLQFFINREKKTEQKRTYLKIGFWISLILIIILPISLNIFKARMLPKADKNQVYLWIDAPRNTNIDITEKIARDVEIFFLGYKKVQIPWEEPRLERIIPKELRIVKDLNISIGDRFMPDFANLFRWGNNRQLEHQISMRINLMPATEREISSEAFVIQIRPLLESMLQAKYKDITMRLLEDPPGPPTQATFHMKLSGGEWTTYRDVATFSNALLALLESIADKQQIVDLSTSFSTTQPGYRIILNHDRIIETGLTEAQVQGTMQNYFREIPLSIKEVNAEQFGSAKIYAQVGRESRSSLNDLQNISFLNREWNRVHLQDIATIQTTFKSNDIYTDEKNETLHIYGEMWSNSVIYPIIELYSLLRSPSFEKSGYSVTWFSPYGLTFVQKETGKIYTLRWGWEWELTMDTFRDLGLAMIFSLFVIYFIIVTQFGSFLVGGIVMTTFLLSFFWIFPGFSLLYITSGTYFTATAMIGAIALGGIVVGNALILIDYINQLIHEGTWIEEAIIEGSKKRFIPVMLTSIAAVAGSFIITSDPVWSGLAWSIIWGLSASAILTLYVIPIFYYSYLRKYSKTTLEQIQHAEHTLFSGVISDDHDTSSHP